MNLVLKDKDGKLLSGRKVIFKAYRNGVELTSGMTLSPTVSDNNGVYRASLKATSIGSVLVKATVTGATAFEISSNLIIVMPTADSGISTLTATPLKIKANGVESSSLKLALKDKNGNLLSGEKVVFKAYRNNAQLSSGITLSAGASTNDGFYHAILKGTSVGDLIVKATIDDDTGFAVSSAKITLDGTDIPSTNNSALIVTPASIIANQRDTATITLDLKDHNNMPLINKTVVFTAYRNNVAITAGIIISQISGDAKYTASLTGVSHGKLLIKATIEGENGFVLVSNEVMLTENTNPPIAGVSSLTSPLVSIPPNGLAIFTLLLKDKKGDALVGKTITLSAYREGAPITTGVTLSGVTDHDDGSYSATFSSQVAGNFHLN